LVLLIESDFELLFLINSKDMNLKRRDTRI
jgi:hypothetical protein